MLLGNSFFSFLAEKFNSEQLLFFLMGIFIGAIIALIIFLIIIKKGKKEIIKKEIDIEWKNKVIMDHQQSFSKCDGSLFELIGYLKDELYEMIFEIASKMNEDSKRPMLEISVDNLIIGVNNITDRIYKLLENFSYEVNSSSTFLNESKAKWYEEDIERLTEELKIKNKLLEEVEIRIKNKNVGLFNRFKKKYDDEYEGYLIEEKNLKSEIKNIQANIKNISKELSYIQNDTVNKNKLLDKIIEKNKDKILDIKLSSILKEGKNKNIVEEKSTLISSIKSTVKDKVISGAMSFVKNAFGLKEILTNIITIVADEVCEIYR